MPETESTCADCGHVHTPHGCAGDPTPSDLWAGVSVATCDCIPIEDLEPDETPQHPAAPETEQGCRYPCGCDQFPEEHCSCMDGHRRCSRCWAPWHPAGTSCVCEMDGCAAVGIGLGDIDGNQHWLCDEHRYPVPNAPAAPETETDANGLREVAYAILDLMPLDPTGHIAQCAWDDSEDHPACGCADLPGQVAAVIAERVRVVEGERDREAEYARYLQTELDADAKHAALKPGESCDVCTHLESEQVQEWMNSDLDYRDRAESAEAAHEAEKAAHERLRAGVLQTADLIDEGVVSGLGGDRSTTLANISTRLRSLLGGGEAR